MSHDDHLRDDHGVCPVGWRRHLHLFTQRWEKFTHHVVHPVSSAIVLIAAGYEVFEWASRAVEMLLHALHAE